MPNPLLPELYRVPPHGLPTTQPLDLTGVRHDIEAALDIISAADRPTVDHHTHTVLAHLHTLLAADLGQSQRPQIHAIHAQARALTTERRIPTPTTPAPDALAYLTELAEYTRCCALLYEQHRDAIRALPPAYGPAHGVH
ncbi:hypothetical protein [Streptomyces sp. NPDC047525]|uniref:hypothetical protein n=1 Tax=Streptomyces sp. NPDC047525 TaxID=3155264 RepID=UPI0033E36FF7